jgi:hypothetical protein
MSSLLHTLDHECRGDAVSERVREDARTRHCMLLKFLDSWDDGPKPESEEIGTERLSVRIGLVRDVKVS